MGSADFSGSSDSSESIHCSFLCFSLLAALLFFFLFPPDTVAV